MSLQGRDFLKEIDFTPDELGYLIDLAEWLKESKRLGKEKKYLRDKNLALLFEKDSTRTRCAFEVGARDQGANVTWIGSTGSQMGKKESIADTARTLSGMFDGIEYRGFGQSRVEELARYSDVPVWNGLTNEWHPTQFLADMLTIREHGHKPLGANSLAYFGDARFNVGNSLMIGAAMLGLDYRCVGPRSLWTSDCVYDIARAIARKTGAEITRTESVAEGARHCDFVYTDVWVSMGEPDEVWEDRIRLLQPYRVTRDVLRQTGNPDVYFLHCLPSFHNRDTIIGEAIYQKFGVDCMEVNDEVFESDRNLAFAQAENRMHTIKAVMVATLAGDLAPALY